MEVPIKTDLNNMNTEGSLVTCRYDIIATCRMNCCYENFQYPNLRVPILVCPSLSDYKHLAQPRPPQYPKGWNPKTYNLTVMSLEVIGALSI